jgi:lipopolysaccharide transport system ATP-binding protein
MRLRLAFSVAIHVDPEVLLIDEVLAVGDLRFREKCLQRLEALSDQGVTTLVASHSTGELERLCSRVVWLVAGVIHEVGPTMQVMEHYREAMALRAPAETTTDGIRREGTGEVEIVSVRLLDRSDRDVDRIASGQPLTIEMEYHAHTPMRDAIFVVSAHTADGRPCFDLNTQSAENSVGAISGHGRVRLSIDRLDLASGMYALDVGVYEANWAKAYDYRWAAYPLEVIADVATGPLAPPHRWSVQ